MSVSHLVSKTKSIGFTGTHGSISNECFKALNHVCSKVSEKAIVSVGTASGIDSFIQRFFSDSLSSYSRLSIFNAFSGDYGKGKNAFIRCNEAKVLSVDNLSGIWTAILSKPFPNDFKPNDKAYRYFNEYEDIYSSIAFSLGLGLRTLIWLPEYINLPALLKVKSEKIDKNWHFFPTSVFYSFNF